MSSMIARFTGFALRATAIAAVSALALPGDRAGAQQGLDPSRLVFEPVPLASAMEPPRDLAEGSERDTQALSNSVDRSLAAIESLRQRRSSTAELIEQLGLLAVAYQDLDRHEEALEILEEAIARTVDDGGRFNLEQIPLQEQKIPSYLALDDIGSVDEIEELIYSLYERSFEPADRQMYYATINLADWNTIAYYRENYGAGTQPLRQRLVMDRVQRCIRVPGTSPGAEASDCRDNAIFTGDIKDVFEEDINDARLREVDRLYASYQAALAERGNVQLDIVIDIAKRIARLAFITKQEMDFERDNYTFDPNYEGSREQAVRNSAARMDESYDSGAAALKYAIDVPSSVATFRPEALAALLLDLADWHLAYGKIAAAGEAYAQAYRVLLAAGFSSANIDLALATEIPPRIPIFATHLYTRQSAGFRPDAELAYDGYVDLSYTVDSLGNAADVRVLGGSSADSAHVEALLERELRSAKFRPTLRGGELTSPGRVEARYYYAY